MTSFESLTGCFLDFLADSIGMGIIISGGGISAARSSSPKMAACWVKSISCMKDMLRFRANSRSWREKGTTRNWKWMDKRGNGIEMITSDVLKGNSTLKQNVFLQYSQIYHQDLNC